jgi:pyrroloquinoline quinone (PQQ) biosynthesis protein C
MGGVVRWHDGDAMTPPRDILAPDDFESALRQIGATRYHNLHRFHRRLHSGQCSLCEVQAWALNRYYYQSMIPI